MTTLIDDLRERFKWRKVVAPRPWQPKEPGGALLGYYGGRTLRTGPHGQYEVAIVHVPREGAFMLTGVRIIQLIDASMIAIGHPIQVVWQGMVDTTAGHQMKNYEVLVADGDAIPAEALPEMAPQGTVH
ncbi:MAG: hypothetical protein A2Y38_23475 [Spirochaetes bacterium GWB1_59_5]|nr:MAG: hypothetical protein A2Y38_23475 [Spirochaetes bacterium GWB1_59_5]